MPDPYRRVQAGEDVEFSAALWNAMGDAAKERKAHEFDQGSEALARQRSGDIVRVRNDSGRNLDRASVLGLNGPLFAPSAGARALEAFLREVAFKGSVPGSAHNGKFAVLLDPIRAGGVGRAFVAGTCPVRLNVVDASHTCADVAGGDTGKLATAEDGTARVLWKESDDTAYGHATGEQWAIVRLGAGCGTSSTGSGARARCDCPGDAADYAVDVTCGDCGAYYGGTMPKTWYATILTGSTPPYGTGYGYCDGEHCDTLKGKTIPMKNVSVGGYGSGGYGEQPTCVWEGKGPSCLHGELTVAGDFWQLTILDKDDCVIALLRKPVAEFDCCGPNSGWTLDHTSACVVTVSVAPDPCTCCPPKGAPCPPDDKPICDETECCVDICGCKIDVTLAGLTTLPGVVCTLFDDPCYNADGTDCVAPVGDPGRLSCFKSLPGPTPERSCGGMNGEFTASWVSPCEWKFSGFTNTSGIPTKIQAVLTMGRKRWHLEIKGANGQTAVFDSTEDWDCRTVVVLPIDGGACYDNLPSKTATATLFICLPIY